VWDLDFKPQYHQEKKKKNSYKTPYLISNQKLGWIQNKTL
jgi:hypothetical protein